MHCERCVLPCLTRAGTSSMLSLGYRGWTASLSTGGHTAAAVDAIDAAALAVRLVVSQTGKGTGVHSFSRLHLNKLGRKLSCWSNSGSSSDPRVSNPAAMGVTSTESGFSGKCETSDALLQNVESRNFPGGLVPSPLAGGATQRVLPAIAENVDIAVTALKQGEVIAVPTDTLYGLAADAQAASAVNKLYEIKGRDLKNPLAICVGDVADVPCYGATGHLPEGLIKKLLPGPVTVILPKDTLSKLHPSLNPGVAGIGVRVPGTGFVRDVARGFGGALALTSANVSGGLSPKSVMEFDDLWHWCTHVFDAGRISGSSSREGSTVVELLEMGVYRILRAGSALDDTVAIMKEFGLQEARQK